MVTRIGGARRKSRAKSRKNQRERGKMSLTRFFAKFETGEKVALVPNSAYHKGTYYRRFHGLIGTVQKQIGTVYSVLIKDGNKEKTVLSHPIHLKKLK